jgi:hypothetical protein
MSKRYEHHISGTLNISQPKYSYMKKLFTFLLLIVITSVHDLRAQSLPVLPAPNFNTDHDAFVLGEVTVNGSTQKIAGVIARLSRIIPGTPDTYVPVSYALSDINGAFRLTGQAGVTYRIDYEFPNAGFTALNANPSGSFTVNAGDNIAPEGGLILSRIANTITNCNVKVPTLTDWVDNILVDKATAINPNAILNSVTVFGSAVTSHPLIQVSATTASNVRALVLGAGVFLSGPGGYENTFEAVKSFAGLQPSQNIVLAAGETLTYYDVSSGRSVNTLLSPVAAEYTGTGQVSFAAGASGLKTITTSGGNTSSSEQTYATAGVCLTYTYTTDPLPVTLSHFNATLLPVENEKASVKVDWTTTAETNSDRFEIERSGDTKNWASIASVNAMGESRITNNYSFTDHSPLEGTNYYRLKMVDADETFAYSSIKVVKLQSTSSVKIYPNPVTETIFIDEKILDQLSGVSIQTQRGNTILTSNNKNDISKGLNVKNLNSGLYFVNLKYSSGLIKTQKIVVRK